MQKKVIIWPRTVLSFFCISKFLKEKSDVKLFLMVDDNHVSKKFYEKQKIVQFEEIIFFNDYIFKKFKTPDMEYLKSFEKKYNIFLWKLAFSDRYFYGYNMYKKFSSEEILAILEYSCRFF